MIKLIIFDLDGVLVDARELHYNALNRALKSIDEKPVQKFFVNAGIYLINPKEIKLIPQNKFFDMPELFKILSKKNKKIVAYPVTENWSDAGSFEELKKFNVNLN